MDKKVLRGTDWQRHEENVSKLRQDRMAPDLWDIGVSEDLQRFIQPDQLDETIMQILEMTPEGLTVVNLGGQKVYVFKEKRRAELGLRADMVRLWGEDRVAQIDAHILGGQ